MSLVVEIVVAALLACTIVYAFVLNRRLTELRKDKAQLERLAVSFNHATQRAETSVHKLKTTADEAVQSMQTCISEALDLREDLQYLLERGEATADQLENSIRNARRGKQARAGHAAAEQSPVIERRDVGGLVDEAPVASDATPEETLMRALRAAR